MSPPPAATAPAPISWPWWVLLAAAASALAWFAIAVAARLPYPHELEWMEGALADHASRVVDGLPVYCEPGPTHVPFLYAPLLFWLGGLGMALGIDGIVALRLVAIAGTVGSAMLVGHWVRAATGRVVPGLVAVGLFVAGYGWLAWWYDLARNDTLFVFCMLLTAFLLRHGGRRGWFWAGLAATAALLAKQSALLWLPALGVGALCRDWRAAVRFGLTAVSGMAAAVGILHFASDGWSTFYLFEMPRHHGWIGDKKLGFWTEDVLPMTPLLALGVLGFAANVRRRPGDALYLAAFGAGGLIASWVSRMHVGGFDNVMMYGFAAGCVLGPIAAAAHPRWLRVAGPLLLLVQFAWLGHAAWRRDPGRTLFPSAAHRQAHGQLRAFVAAQDGPVWVPGHGHIAWRAGKGTGAHGQAIFDLMQLLPKLPDGMLDLAALTDPAKLAPLSPRARHALATFLASTEASLRGRYFAAVVVDSFGTPPVDAFMALFGAFLTGPDGVPGTADDPYVRRAEPLLSDPDAIRPLLGYEVCLPYALVRR